ncbi:hypothetical protein FRC98_04010 [Lujinxingia vulgaris]|uniref:Uncharacterized protein n=1 Tax=Lujinxingia vulgaris TaxID=2600176 RepID=A0A5C6X872_9DELT|nr:hypothetical protein [Lujinxingia vulgaris]TXD38071.1 hypothetical protein FRC98_04010 [Lujinxingia vulgaris]
MSDRAHVPPSGWKTQAQQLGHALLACAALLAFLIVTSLAEEVDPLLMAFMLLTALLFLVRRARRRDPDARPTTAWGRMFAALFRVWMASHLVLGSIALAAGGVWMLAKEFLGGYFTPNQLLMLASLPAAWLYVVSLFLANANTIQGEPTSIAVAIKRTFPRTLPMVLAALLFCFVSSGLEVVLQTTTSSAALIWEGRAVTALITILLFPFVPLMLFEGRSLLSAPVTALRMTRTQWGRLVWIYLIMQLSGLLAMQIQIAITYGLADLSNLFVEVIANDVIHRLAQVILTGPILGAYLLMLFYSTPMMVIVPLAAYRFLAGERTASNSPPA